MTAFDDGLWTRLVDGHRADRVALGPIPAPRSRRPLLVGVSGAGALGIAGVLAVVLWLAGGASSAFAGWTPQPTRPTAGQVAAARTYCAANVPTRGLPLKLADTRGPFTILVYSNGTSNDFCTVGPSWRSASGWSTSPAVTPATGKLFLWTDHTSTADGQSYGSMIARTGHDVSTAKLTLDDGSVVTATVENGWAVAWWPGTRHLAAARLTTPTGTQTQTFPRYPCDVHNCAGGGAHGGAPGGGPGGG
jgi:hypothetical protein